MKLLILLSVLVLLLMACATEPEPTNTPAPTTIPVNLTTTTQAALWIYILDSEFEWIDVYADSAFDLDTYDLEVIVDGEEFCNTNRMYSDEGAYELSCGILEVRHQSVQRVSAQTPYGDLRCQRNVASTSTESKWACAWRE